MLSFYFKHNVTFHQPPTKNLVNNNATTAGKFLRGRLSQKQNPQTVQKNLRFHKNLS